VTSGLRATLVLLRKELLVELRTGEIVVSTGLFATLVAVLTSLAFYLDAERARALAPGVLWIALVFGGVLAMGRSWSRERELDAFRALLLAPVPRGAIYASKLIASIAFLLVVEALLVVEVAVLFNLALSDVALPLCALLLLGTVGFAATGNLFAALAVRTRGREMLLSVALMPIVAPALLCGVVGTRELLTGAPLSEVYAWMRLLGAADLVFLAAGIALFDPLIAD
jgi:heme exporter protein B